MPGLLSHGQGMPGLVSLDPSPAQTRRPFPRANELLCDIRQIVAAVEEGRAWGSVPSGAKPDGTKDKRKKDLKKSGISAMSKASFPLVKTENVR